MPDLEHDHLKDLSDMIREELKEYWKPTREKQKPSSKKKPAKMPETAEQREETEENDQSQPMAFGFGQSGDVSSQSQVQNEKPAAQVVENEAEEVEEVMRFDHSQIPKEKHIIKPDQPVDFGFKTPSPFETTQKNTQDDVNFDNPEDLFDSCEKPE